MDMNQDSFVDFPQGIKWLWVGQQKANQYVGVLREFTLEAGYESAQMHIFADALYKVYINGVFVNTGPTPFRKPVMHVDTYDLGKYLIPGRNSLFILCHNFGVDIKMQNSTRAGVIASMQAGDLVIHTGDGAWRGWELDCWTTDTPRINWARAFVEEFDFLKQSANVLATYAAEDYSVSGDLKIPPPEELVAYSLEESKFCNRITPNLRWRYETELRMDEAYMLNPQVQNLNDIYDRYYTDHKEPLYDAVKYTMTDSEGYTVLDRVKGGKGYGVVYDLQRVVAGNVKLEVIADCDCTVDICMAEGKLHGVPFFSPGGSKFYFRMKCRKGRNVFRCYKFYGWRYLYIVAKDFEGKLCVKPVSCHCRADIEYLDSFSCGDMELEAIYAISKRSIMLNTQACTYDCNSREIGTYWADSMWISEMIGQMSGDFSHMKQLCYMMTDEYRMLGRLNSSAFGIGNTLYDFCLVVVQMLHRYYLNTADIDTLKDNISTCESIISDFRKSKDQSGLVTVSGMEKVYDDDNGFLFLDHAGTGWHPMQTVAIERKDHSSGLNLYYLLALKSLSSMKNTLNANNESIEKEINEISCILYDKFYDENKGLVADMVEPDGKKAGYSQIINALAVIAEVVPNEKYSDVMSMIVDPQRYKWIAQGTPYSWLYLAEAARLSGTVVPCLYSIRKYWLGMLERGATTAWEAFGGENHDSLNHAWSAVLPQLITRGVAGVFPVEPGYGKVGVRPCLEALDNFSHTFVLPQGKAEISWQRQGAKAYQISIVLPEFVEGVLLLNSDMEKVKFTGSHSQVVLL